jgi:hypothetical protein
VKNKEAVGKCALAVRTCMCAPRDKRSTVSRTVNTPRVSEHEQSRHQVPAITSSTKEGNNIAASSKNERAASGLATALDRPVRFRNGTYTGTEEVFTVESDEMSPSGGLGLSKSKRKRTRVDVETELFGKKIIELD